MINHYGIQDLRNLDLNILRKIKSSEIVTNGKYCQELEQKIKSTVSSKYCVVCNSGTSALMMSLMALKLKKIIAIIPNINFVAISSIISIFKGKIALCDVNLNTGMVDIDSFKNVIKECDKKNIKPNLFVPVHYAGNIAVLKGISKICKKRKINIIEDGCHSFGSYKLNNNVKEYVGNCANSKMTTFSFHPVKNITTFEGGAITTNNKSFYEKLILLRSHSLKKTSLIEPYELIIPSLNFRLNELSALIGISQLKQLIKFKKQRNKIVYQYLKLLNKLEKYLVSINFSNPNIFWHLFVVKIKDLNRQKKLKFMNYLKRNNIACQIHYKPLYKHKIYKKNIVINQYNNSEVFYKSIISLPLHTRMIEKDVIKIVNIVKKFFFRFSNV